jgi:hypothetical protein
MSDDRLYAKLEFHKALLVAMVSSKLNPDLVADALADGYAEIDRLVGDAEGREKRAGRWETTLSDMPPEDWFVKGRDPLVAALADRGDFVPTSVPNDAATPYVRIPTGETSWTAGGPKSTHAYMAPSYAPCIGCGLPPGDHER